MPLCGSILASSSTGTSASLHDRSLFAALRRFGYLSAVAAYAAAAIVHRRPIPPEASSSDALPVLLHRGAAASAMAFAPPLRYFAEGRRFPSIEVELPHTPPSHHRPL